MRLSFDPTGEIDEFVEQLQAAQSPWEKVKVVAKTWRTVRKLRPEERVLVAKHVGLEGAEAFLDRLSDPYRGLPTDELLDIVRAADAQDLARWKRIVAGLRRPEERESFLRKGVEGVREALLEDAEKRTKTELPQPELREEQPEEPIPLPPPPEPAERVDSAESTAQVVKEVEPELEGREAVGEPSRAGESVEPGLEVDEEPAAEVGEEVDAEPEVDFTEAKWEKEQPQKKSVPTDSVQRPLLDRLFEQLVTSGHLLGRFRRFRAMTQDIQDLAIGELETLLGCFPEGWARRRALTEILRAGIPADFQDALSLVEKRDKVMDRLWCLSALVEGRRLSADEKEVLLSLQDAPMISRRLHLLLGDGDREKGHSRQQD